MSSSLPANLAPFSRAELMLATGAKFSGEGDFSTVGVTTDSRADVRGKLFVALKGERFDGHAYVEDVLAAGAAAVLVEQSYQSSRVERVGRVGDTLHAIGQLAAAHRRRWGGRLVAVAGSAGKTTTRVAVETVLRSVAGQRVHCTSGNLNNLIGVPLTLLALEPSHQLAVVEVGTNAPGEVARLATICAPNASVLTCIGLEHTLGLASLDGVKQEEAEAFRCLDSQGIAIGNLDDAAIRELLSEVRLGASHSYGQAPEADTRILGRRPASDGRQVVTFVTRALGPFELELPLLGLPGALAFAAGLAVAESLGVGLALESLRAQLAQSLLGEPGRLRLIAAPSGATVIDDCYNANPASMRSSLRVARELAAERGQELVLVLGDMLELGTLSEAEHAALAEDCRGVRRLLVVGRESRVLAKAAQGLQICTTWYETAADAVTEVRGESSKNTLILVKGSRGLRMERIVAALETTEGESA